MNQYLKSLTSAILFSFLLYDKSIGINLFLSAIVVIVLLITNARERKIPTIYLLTYVCTALVVFFDPTDFKIFIHLMALLVLVGKSIAAKASLYLCWLIGLATIPTASIARYFSKQGKSGNAKRPFSSKNRDYIKGGLVAISLIWLFTMLYRKANPVFEELLQQIDLSFISLPWLLFIFLSFIFFLHLLRPYHPRRLIVFDKNQSNQLVAPPIPFAGNIVLKLKGEQRIGCLVLGSLNLLLFFYLITDLVYLAHKNVLGISAHSQAVHQGVYALMFSIVCAIVIILYFFRGPLNFMENNKFLKILAYTWIVLNVLLVLFTGYKNYHYVEALGVTYKRIGVFVYLVLVLIGLVTTTIKVLKTLSFTFLVRTNTVALFTLLLLSACIPWDRAITGYNIAHIKNPDMMYLLGLGGTNSDQLYRYEKENRTVLPLHYRQAIQRKYAKFKSKVVEKDWQEYTVYGLLLKRRN